MTLVDCIWLSRSGIRCLIVAHSNPVDHWDAYTEHVEGPAT